MADLFSLLRPLLHLLPPEKVHEFGLEALMCGFVLAPKITHHPELAVSAFGLNFPNPVGLAAGFDKNALVTGALLKQGFGFVEAGTVTPRPQMGNPRPRIFRLVDDEAVINRLGFNNDGLISFVSHLQERDKTLGIVGANIGMNKNAVDAARDYMQGLSAIYSQVDYVTINISSPNTPGLRELQTRGALEKLLDALAEIYIQCQTIHGRSLPLLLKVAPDLSDKEMEDIAALSLSHGIDGLIVGNTTLSRPPLRSNRSGEEGGLSGRPLFALSTDRLKTFYQLTGGKIPLIGVGGVSGAQDAYAKIRAGAMLVQLYTAIVYQGFAVVRDIKTGLLELLKRDGFENIMQAVGVDAR